VLAAAVAWLTPARPAERTIGHTSHIGDGRHA
jgi:hypothetical protein